MKIQIHAPPRNKISHPPTKTLFLVLSSVLLALTVRADTTVFDTFGPGDTYTAFTSYGVTNFVPFEIAAQFTAAASGNLSGLDLGLTYGGRRQAL
jgi:hypothetical protein